MSYQLSKKEAIREIVKCGKDPSYFINNYTRISHPLEGLISFKTYPYQDELLKDFNDYRFNIILKARQLGISTISAAYIVWLMLFHRDKNVLVIATKFATAANLVKKVKNIMQYLPPWIRIAEIKIDNRTSFVLTNGSEVGRLLRLAMLDVRKPCLFLLLTRPRTLKARRIVRLVSYTFHRWSLYCTVHPKWRCWFHKTYVEAEQNVNDFHPVNLPWDVHPDRDQEWLRKRQEICLAAKLHKSWSVTLTPRVKP